MSQNANTMHLDLIKTQANRYIEIRKVKKRKKKI